jgi:hypothetical protein
VAHTPLSDDEQREVAKRATALNKAIVSGASAEVLLDLHRELQRAYRGDAIGLVAQFATAPDKLAWSQALRVALADDVATKHWIAAVEDPER